MTTQELIAALPGAFQDWATTYAPYLTTWTADDLTAWIAALKAGDVAAAEEKACAAMDETAKLTEEQRLLDAAKAARTAHASRLAAAKQMVWTFLATAVSAVMG